jgi:hypothetical protein
MQALRSELPAYSSVFQRIPAYSNVFFPETRIARMNTNPDLTQRRKGQRLRQGHIDTSPLEFVVPLGPSPGVATQ